jgi:hypothetical protein
MRRRKGDACETARQLTIFDLIKEDEEKTEPAPGSMDIGNRLKNELSEGLRRCMLSRFEVASKMSELVGAEITKSMLDSWTAESKEYHRFPAEYLPAFCAVTGHKEPLRLMARMIKCYLLEGKEALMAELGQIDQMRRELAKREKAVRNLLERLGA